MYKADKKSLLLFKFLLQHTEPLAPRRLSNDITSCMKEEINHQARVSSWVFMTGAEGGKMKPKLRNTILLNFIYLLLLLLLFG